MRELGLKGRSIAGSGLVMVGGLVASVMWVMWGGSVAWVMWGGSVALAMWGGLAALGGRMALVMRGGLVALARLTASDRPVTLSRRTNLLLLAVALFAAGCIDLADLPSLPSSAPSSATVSVMVSQASETSSREVSASVVLDPGRLNGDVRALLDSTFIVQGISSGFTRGGSEGQVWLANASQELRQDTIVVGLPSLEGIPGLSLRSVLPSPTSGSLIEPDSLGVLRFPTRVPFPMLGQPGDATDVEPAALQTANWTLRLRIEDGTRSIALAGSGAPPPVVEVFASVFGPKSSTQSPEEWTGELSVAATYTAELGSGTSRQLVVVVLREDVIVRVRI